VSEGSVGVYEVRQFLRSYGGEFTRAGLAAHLGLRWPSQLKEPLKRLKRLGEIEVVGVRRCQRRTYVYRAVRPHELRDEA
jgi:hypothetical protein